MREMLFRGKRVDNGEWVYGGYVKEDRDNSHLIFVNELGAINAGFKPKREDFILNYYEVDPKTVGQYTGLKDKNGNKIFEGDILIFDGDMFVISWNDERCGFRMNYWMLDEQYDLSEFWPTSEIIGNVHDNPELVGMCSSKLFRLEKNQTYLPF